jgi:hypothetical protein
MDALRFVQKEKHCMRLSALPELYVSFHVLMIKNIHIQYSV